MTFKQHIPLHVRRQFPRHRRLHYRRGAQPAGLYQQHQSLRRRRRR